MSTAMVVSFPKKAIVRSKRDQQTITKLQRQLMKQYGDTAEKAYQLACVALEVTKDVFGKNTLK